MPRHLIVLTLSLVALTSQVMAPAVALAGRGHGRPGGGAHMVAARPGGGAHMVAARPGPTHGARPGGGHPGGGRPGGGHSGGGAHFGGHPGRHHQFGGSSFVGVFATPVYAPWLGYYGSSIYDAPMSYEPPVSYDPPMYAPPSYYDVSAYGRPPMGAVSVAPSPPPPSSPGVVEYANGRYELRGDGMSAPYTWVWIPNPPPAPPDGASDGDEPARPRRHSQLYRWTDAEGVTYWTDRADAVPEQYRTAPR